jgi:hypothetical protein
MTAWSSGQHKRLRCGRRTGIWVKILGAEELLVIGGDGAALELVVVSWGVSGGVEGDGGGGGERRDDRDGGDVCGQGDVGIAHGHAFLDLVVDAGLADIAGGVFCEL